MRADQTGRSDLPRGKRRTRSRLASRLSRRARLGGRTPSPRERGTILLMVLGVLALMAIIMVVYAAIGKSDRVTSAAQIRTRRLDDQVDSFARYLADVIGRDVFATYAQEDDRVGNAANLLPLDPKLEAFDAPNTDVMMVSQRDPDDATWQNIQRDGFYGFNPEGSYAKSWREQNSPGTGTPANRRDPRSPSDPYVAATEPIWRNRYSPDWTWREYAAGEDYMNLRDWAHISNFAPSGNFVNLWALRNNFRAKPGFRTPLDGPGEAPKLSDLLSTIDPATGYSYPINVANRTNPNQDILGAIRAGDLISSVRLNRPSDWTRDQIGAFRTTSELITGNGANEAPYGVDDPEFMPYQWVDADGDGFYDSRLFELVDIFDPENPRSVIANAGRARLFLGARCVDLSGLVNVNTASDFQFQPRRNFAISRPASGEDADPLRSLDRPNPVRNSNGSVPGLASRPPRLQNPPQNEDDVDINDLTDRGWVDYRRSVETSYQIPAGLTPADIDLQRLLRLSDNYYAYDVGARGAGYLDLPQPPNTGPTALAGDYRAYVSDEDNGRNLVLGNAAYQAIWQARQSSLPNDRRFVNPDQPDLVNGDAPFVDTLRVAERRFSFYDNVGRRREPGRQRDSGVLNRYGVAFDEADELELRTFQGLNDPDRTSRLETTVAGRYDLDADLYSLSPLRDNRAAALERAGRDLAPPELATGAAPGQNNPYRKALLATQLDIRRLLTTISGARPIIDDVLVTVKTDSSANIVDGTPIELSEAARTLRVDGSRLISQMVEPGNWSFNNKQPGTRTTLSDSETVCDWFDDIYTSTELDLSRNTVNKIAFERENIFDNLGFYEFVPDAQDRPWFYQLLDNRPNPARRVRSTPPARDELPEEPLVGKLPPTDTGGRGPDTENYVTSRLELMREAFRAYADCLLPYTQWGSNPRQPSNVDGPFPDAWTIDNNFNPVNPTLAYGGDPELAYRMAAHMAVNLRDAVDMDRRVSLTRDPISPSNTHLDIRDDHMQTMVSLDLTQQAMLDYTNNPSGAIDPLAPGTPLRPDSRPWKSGTLNSDYQRDRNYPWPKLNLDDRGTTTDDRVARTRMPRDPASVTSTGHMSNEAVKKVNIVGIEPQPFITQVTAMAMFSDSPPSPTHTPSGDDDECVPGRVSDPTSPGGFRQETCDEARARLESAGEEACRVTISLTRRIEGTDPSNNNSDFLCYLIAFQVTNPFDTDIVLEPEDPSKNDSWYYLEYANRFYRLCPQDYRQPFDGLRRNLTESQRILKPGETRVYYATYPNSLKDISVRLNQQRWGQFEWTGHGTAPDQNTAPLDPESMGEDADRDTDPSLLVPVVENLLKHEFGQTCIHVAPMFPETGRAIGASRNGTLGSQIADRTYRLGNSNDVSSSSDPVRSIDLFAISEGASFNARPILDGPDFENTQVTGTNPDRRQRLLDDLPEIKLSTTGPTWSISDKIAVESDPRRRVLLWRVMRDPDSVDGGVDDLDPQLIARAVSDPTNALKPNWIGNDLLLDRLYDPSPIPVVTPDRPLRDADGQTVALTPAEQAEIIRSSNGALIQALVAPFRRRLDLTNIPSAESNSVVSIPDTDNCIRPPSNRGPDETGFTLVSWVSITRPTNPPRPRGDTADRLGREPEGMSPIGALPPWCMEAKPDNVYEPGFTRLYTPDLANASSGATSEEERRSTSLNRVRKSFGLKRGPVYKDMSENSASTYYRRFTEMLEVHAQTPLAGEFFDSAFTFYPSDYLTGNANATSPTKFFDANLATRFADRRGAKGLRPFDDVNPGLSPSIRALKGDVREAIDMSEIDSRRSVAGAETDEFFNRSGTGRAGMKPKRFDEVAIELHRLPTDMTGTADPQATGTRALFSRVGDFLLPLAIGPSFDPAAGYTPRNIDYGQGPVAESLDPLNPINPPGTNPRVTDPRASGPAELRFARRQAMLDNQWTTLAEAIATAADYYSGPRVRENRKWVSPSTNASATPTREDGFQRNIFYRFARDTRGEINRDNASPLNAADQEDVLVPKGDRGHLVLDAWSPYLDYNTGTSPADRRYNWAPLDPSDTASLRARRDAPLGNGIPMALNVLNKFRVAGLPGETQAKPNDLRLCTRSSGNPVRPLPTVGNQFARTGRGTAYGSATAMEPGKININTAPQAVLRLLPLVSPTRDLLDTNLRNVLDGWLFDSRHDAMLGQSLVTPLTVSRIVYDTAAPEVSPNPATPRSPSKVLWDPDATDNDKQPWDIAVTLDAYRHNLAMDSRRLNPTAEPTEINYRNDRNGGGSPPTRSGRDDAFAINADATSQGGLRDQPGFKSIGEVMAAVIKKSTDMNVIDRAKDDNHKFPLRLPIDTENSMTRLAHDGASNRSLAFDSVGYAQAQVSTDLAPQGRSTAQIGSPSALRPVSTSFLPSQVLTDVPVIAGDGLVNAAGQRIVNDGLVEGADTIADDYDEKLSIANAILNNITVRSDVFGVWFVIQGYTPEDVLVDDGFPMVPSISKRYFMVVDRSNVSTPTAKPRIVMLREVPNP